MRKNRLIFTMLLALALTAGLLGVTASTARADVNLFVTVKDCVTGKPIAGAQIKVPTANLSLKSANQAVANDQGVANVDPLRTEGKHQIEVSAPGYLSKTLDVSFAAWTRQDIEVCLQPENASSSSKPPAAASDCDRAKLAAAEQRVADLEAKVDQAQDEIGNAVNRFLFARDDYLEAKTKAALSQNRANDSARLAGTARQYAETVIQLAKDKPGSSDFAKYMEKARFRAEMASGRALDAVNEGVGSLQGLIEIDRKLTGLIQFEVIDHYGAPNPYTDAQYVQAAQDMIALADRAAQIAQQAADVLRGKRDEAFAKMEAARAEYQKAKEAKTAIQSELRQARAEWRKLRAACRRSWLVR